MAAVFAATMPATSAGADCPDTSNAEPAQLIESVDQDALIDGLVDPWESDNPVIYATAVGIVDKRGRLAQVCCMTSSPELNRSANQDLVDRLKKLRFTPARISGKPAWVTLSFTVVLRKTDSGVVSELMLNHGLSSAVHGLNYLAPQRLRSKRMWPQSRFNIIPMWGEITVEVDKKGQARNSRISRMESGPESLMQRLEAKMNDQCFIPGFVAGVATDMQYSEAFVAR